MKKMAGAAVCLGVVLAGATTVAVAADLPAAAQVDSSNSWARIAKWPDFMTGMWAENYNYGGRMKAPLTAAAQAQLQKRPRSAEGNGASCKPLGMPGMLMPGYPMAFFYTRGSIFIMSDMDDLLVRHVSMDRTAHGDPDPSWNGDSIGHWEGGTLVIDTTAINEDVPLAELPSLGKTHILEHIRLTAPDKLEWQTTITNPDLLTGPWSFTKTYVRHADWHIQMAACVEGNRDTPDANGKPQVDLTPPSN